MKKWKYKSILAEAINNLEAAEMVAKVANDRVRYCQKKCGEAFRKERKAAGIGLRELAKKIGISAAYLSDIELGRRNFPKNIKVTL